MKIGDNLIKKPLLTSGEAFFTWLYVSLSPNQLAAIAARF